MLQKELIFNDRIFKTNKLLLLFVGPLFEVCEAENGEILSAIDLQQRSKFRALGWLSGLHLFTAEF